MASINRHSIEVMANTIRYTSFVEYDEYLNLMCPKEEHINTLIKNKGLSLGFGTSHLRSYFLMKSDFKKWFLFEINELQRERFIEFIETHNDILLDRFKESVETEINNISCINHPCCKENNLSFIS